MNIQNKIDKLIPYVSENFITYPLWEEGKYIPFINFWRICKNNEEFNILIKKMVELKYVGDYKLELIDENIIGEKPFYLQMYPEFEETSEGGYEYVKKDWSIEEMIEIVGELIKK